MVSFRSSSCLSPDPVIPGLFLPRSRPCLLDKAAEGGLEPAPASRFRGADPHQLNSCAPPQPFGCLLCSWHTIVGKPETWTHSLLKERHFSDNAVIRQVNRCLFPYATISSVKTVAHEIYLRWNTQAGTQKVRLTAYRVRACSSVDCSTRRANLSSAFSAGRSSRHEMGIASSVRLPHNAIARTAWLT